MEIDNPSNAIIGAAIEVAMTPWFGRRTLSGSPAAGPRARTGIAGCLAPWPSPILPDRPPVLHEKRERATESIPGNSLGQGPASPLSIKVLCQPLRHEKLAGVKKIFVLG